MSVGDVSPMATHTPAVVQPGVDRVAFLDLLRCVAAFQMIQGHTIAALLAPEHRHGVVHGLWSQARGLTSVAFLFTAGFAFYVTTRTREHARKRVLRGAQLLTLGYVLHLPVAWLMSTDAVARDAALRGFIAVDVLQCIGVSLLLLQALRSTLRSATAMLAGSTVLCVLALSLAPWAASWPVRGMAAPLLAYVSPQLASPFPLLPWAGHMFFGAACAAWMERSSRWPNSVRLAGVAGGLGVAALVLEAGLGRGLVSMHVARLGGVVLVAACLTTLAMRLGGVPGVLRTLAGGSLTLYVVHILIVYGAGIGLADRVGPTLSPAAAVLVAAGVLGVSVAAVLVPERLRARRLAAATVAG
jgi:uncharacterized membrane protein